LTALLDSAADEVLVSAAMHGDRDAMSALWRRHRRWVAAVLLTYKPREADLEDLLQEVAMRLVGKIDTLREGANVRAWLRAVAVNVARSAGRGSRPALRFEGEEVETAAAGPAPAAPASEQREDLHRLVTMVGRLPESYREPLLLRAVHGLRAKEIAAILDLPPATVDTRIARARRMLRDLVEPLEDTTAPAACPQGADLRSAP
jgi:RNA polymerase sigma-70 factor (ECF subfamily)